MFALLKEARVTERADRIALYCWVTAHPDVESTDDLNRHEIDAIVNMLATWSRVGMLESCCREAIDDYRRGDDTAPASGTQRP